MKTPKQKIEQFVNRVLGQYSPLLSYELVHEDHGSDWADYGVIIHNNTNDQITHVPLQANDNDDQIELLKGEDFYAVDETAFAMYLFLCNFLTVPEQ